MISVVPPMVRRRPDQWLWRVNPMRSHSLRVVIPTLLALFLACTGGSVAAQEDNKTAALTGKWKGKCIESGGYTNEIPLELAAEDKGKVSGSFNTMKIEHGFRVADTITWTSRVNQGKGGADVVYLVYGRIRDGGKKLTLEYNFVAEEDGRLHKVTGTAILHKE